MSKLNRVLRSYVPVDVKPVTPLRPQPIIIETPTLQWGRTSSFDFAPVESDGGGIGIAPEDQEPIVENREIVAPAQITKDTARLDQIITRNDEGSTGNTEWEPNGLTVDLFQEFAWDFVGGRSRWKSTAFDSALVPDGISFSFTQTLYPLKLGASAPVRFYHYSLTGATRELSKRETWHVPGARDFGQVPWPTGGYQETI